MLIAVYMIYLVRTPRFYMYYYFLSFLTFNLQLSQRKPDLRQTQRLIHKIILLIIGTGTLTGQLFSTPNSDHVFTFVQPASQSLTSFWF
jgi:hypothetical protein